MIFDNQQVFDTVTAHLIAQGGAAVDDKGLCKYRMTDGRSCAVGCLIPDELYTSDMEESSTTEPGIRACLEQMYPEGYDSDLLCALQACHDNLLSKNGLGVWAVDMRRLALAYDLIVPSALHTLIREVTL
jgi:hypothetical protein